MIKKCLECETEFETNSGRKSTCNEECKLKRKKRFRDASIDRRKEKFNCVYCDKEVFRYRKRGGFCSRSCASKKFLEEGVYDNWRYRIQEKKGIIKSCIICEKEYYAQPREITTKKTCSAKCSRKAFSEHMKKFNPSKGKKEKPGVREKVKQTLMKKYGVENAYELAKHTSLSRPHKEILEYLTANTKHTILSDFPIHINSKCYKVDILIKELNTIIEFNGTYWHCDPRFYNENYFHKRKQLHAKEIWELDKIRIENLNSLGYNVKIIWEFDYMENKQNILLEMLHE